MKDVTFEFNYESPFLLYDVTDIITMSAWVNGGSASLCVAAGALALRSFYRLGWRRLRLRLRGVAEEDGE